EGSFHHLLLLHHQDATSKLWWKRIPISRGRKAVVFLHNSSHDLPLKTSCEEES
ncbi:unnamed protein product, partial [Musa acuminata var. zebrina]